MSGLMFEKPRPLALDRADKKRQRLNVDRVESEKARKRAKGRCEVTVIGEGRCTRKDTETHHLLGGMMRGRGESAKAERKVRACHTCHQAITQHVLVRVGGVMPHWRDPYRRVTYGGCDELRPHPA